MCAAVAAPPAGCGRLMAPGKSAASRVEHWSIGTPLGPSLSNFLGVSREFFSFFPLRQGGAHMDEATINVAGRRSGSVQMCAASVERTLMSYCRIGNEIRLHGGTRPYGFAHSLGGRFGSINNIQLAM